METALNAEPENAVVENVDFNFRIYKRYSYFISFANFNSTKFILNFASFSNTKYFQCFIFQ